jgi:hypothetical protein
MGTSASMAGGILTISGGILTALTGTATFIYQCCGSGMFIPDPTFFHPGSVPDPPDPHVFAFWASWINIRILLSLSKYSRKNLDFYCFVTSF